MSAPNIAEMSRASSADPRRVVLDLSGDEALLLEEALRLTPERRPQRIIELALREWVERQRFRAWVDDHRERP